TLDRVASALEEQAVGRMPRGSAEFSGITTDTRKIAKGNVFVALIGEKFDGHDYLRDAVRDGAAALVVSKAPKIDTLGVPIYEVRDTLVALGALANYWRRAWGKTIVGVAGSNGKTSTKDLLRAALGRSYNVHATTGNLNNRIGVPLTLLALPPEADLAVVELGTSLPGEVAILKDIAEPDIALVTSIAEEHLEGLGDLAGVLREEAAVYEGIGVAIAPSAQPEIAKAARAKAKRVVVAGLDSNADLKPDKWEIGPDGLGVIEIAGVTVKPPVRGLHNLRNAMLALAVARECGVSYEDAAEGIAGMPQPKMRSAWEQVGDVTLINDAYNANPGSTRAAIELLQGTGSGRQRVIVLGTMRELGAASEQCHADIAGLALASGADIVAGIGEFAPALEKHNERERVITAPDVDDLWPQLQARLQRNAIILLKASRGVQLERLVPHLTTWATA
ncbi:MAG TPA: UDP-N-acetylmuramoyl-tripeptide--D-alanyl-D-alanine ligase, partial [Gemmatimonadaceae bacterium]|nr:UDP-N-acetylmuramoyl-tripeptide--D-alanyl-D-alanine ligase [Gemmatimonadaceae bacterium]